MATKKNKDRQLRSWMSLATTPTFAMSDDDEETQDETSGMKSDIMRQVQLNTQGKYSPLFSNNVDSRRVASEMLNEEEQGLDTEAAGPAVKLVEPEKSVTKEGQVLGKMQNTNLAPRSIWRRLIEGAGQGAQNINVANDTVGSAIGKILGATVTNAIPQVDVGLQKRQQEIQRKKTLEQAKQEGLIIEEQQQRRQRDLNIQKTEAELKQLPQKQAEEKEKTRALNEARLAKDKRDAANDLFDQLKNTPAEDKETRKALVKQLKDEYGIKSVSENYGITSDRQQYRTVYDEESGNYIRVDAKGNKVLDKSGKPEVVRPGKDESTTRAAAESQVPPVMKGALQAQAIQDARKQFGAEAKKMNDAELISDPTYGPWIQARINGLVSEATEKRKQQVYGKQAEKKKGSTTTQTKVQPSAKAPKDFRTYIRLGEQK